MEKNSILNIMNQCFRKILPQEDSRTQISPLHFIIALVFCYLGDTKIHSLEAKRRHMMNMLNQRIAKSSFWGRLSRKRLKNMLKLILSDLMIKFTYSKQMGKKILLGLKVKKIFLMDSSSMTLWDGSNENYPGTRTNAGIKWHCCLNLLSGVMAWFKLSPTTTSDRKCFPPLKLLRGSLIIFDLGYWDYGLFLAIEKAKGLYLSRMKINSAIRILFVVSGLPQGYVGKTMSSLDFKKKRRDIIEIIGFIVAEGLHVRIIGFWNPHEKKYHWYVTNLEVAASVIYPLYKIRWELELVFKSCKQSLNINQIPSNHPNIIESLLLASLVSHLATRTILDIATTELSKEQINSISFQRLAKVVANLGSDFIKFFLNPSKRNLKLLIEKIKLFINELFDPNYLKRKTSMQKLNEEILNAEIPMKNKKRNNLAKVLPLCPSRRIEKSEIIKRKAA